MKLVKLSLAAAIATGAFSTVSAMALEDAIKNIETSGYLRYRYESDRTTIENNGNKVFNGGGFNAEADQRHRYRAHVNFKAALVDNLSLNIALRYDSKDPGFYANNYNQTINNVQAWEPTSDLQTAFYVNKFFVTYNNENTNTQVHVGKQAIGTMFTDDLSGTGIKIVNNSIENVTFAALMFDNSDYGESTKTDNTLTEIDPNTGAFKTIKEAVFQGNLYGLGAYVNFEPASLNLEVAHSVDGATMYAIDAAANFALGDGNIGAHAQYFGNSVVNRLKTMGIDDGAYYAGEVTANAMGFDASAGYYTYGDKNHVTTITLDDVGGLIYAGESLIYSPNSATYGSLGENKFMFVKLGYTYNDTVRLGGEYITGDTKYNKSSMGLVTTENKDDKDEYVVRLSYKYSDALNFTSFWSHYTVENKNNINVLGDGKTETKGDFLRFQAQYNW